MRDFGLQLLVVDNGFVYVGHVVLDENYYAVTRCKNVRRAGTSKGYGELAYEGPRKESLLDDCPTVLVPAARVCHMIECSHDAWNKVL